MVVTELANAGARVAALMQHAEIREARALAAMRFRIAHGRDVPDEAWPAFEAAMDEWVGNYLFKALASDHAIPRFVPGFLPAGAVQSATWPGARMGGDNPDNHYRLAGIEHGGRYRVTGKLRGDSPANTSFTLVGNWGTSVTIDGVESDALVFDDRGQFAITINDQPDSGGGGAGAHLTTKPGTKFLFVRDTLCDWSRERPYALTIERLDATDHRPLTDDALAAAAAFRLVEDVPLYFWFHRIFSGMDANIIDAPHLSGGLGGLLTQAGSHGRLDLGEDECALISFETADAAYSGFELTDWWFRSLDAHRITSSLNHAQAIPQADGSYQLVAARRDPGVANWLDMGGLANCLLLGRWQGLKPSSPAPHVSMEIARIADLASEAGGGAMDSKGRARQIADRRAAWDRRMELGE